MDIKQIVEQHERWIEIYKVTCTSSNKCYVGQAVSHILNTGKYRRYGMNKRWKCHVSEAASSKKCQCHYLNNAIRKYGKDNFVVELLENCKVEDSAARESHHIINENTMFPNGYNLKLGTATVSLSNEAKRRISDGVIKYYSEQKFSRFDKIDLPDDIDDPKYIRILKRDNKQFGYYVFIKKCKADFGGVHIPLKTAYKMAQQFISKLKLRHEARNLDAGNSLES